MTILSVLFLALFASVSLGSVSIPLPSLYNICDIVAILSTWKCNSTTTACPSDYNNDGLTNLKDIVYVLSRWKGGSQCANVAPLFHGDWSLTLDGPTTICPNEIGTFTAKITFGGAGSVTNFIVQGEAPRFGRAEIVAGSVTLSGPAGWDSGRCVIQNIPGQLSFFSCQSGPSLVPGATMNITYAIKNLGTDIGVFSTDISTSDTAFLLRVTPPLYIDMVCGSSRTTTTTPITTPPAVFSWATSVAGPATICGTRTSNYTVTVVVSAGREDHFLIRGSKNSDTSGNVQFIGTPTTNAPSLFCFVTTGNLVWRCDGPMQGPATIEIKFVLGNVQPVATVARISVLTARRDDDTTDTVNELVISAAAGCTK